MQEEEFMQMVRDMTMFHVERFGLDLGSHLAGQFMQCVWTSQEFPDYWARWASAKDRIEEVLIKNNLNTDDLNEMRREILDDMINRPKTKPEEEVPAWSQN